MLRSMFRALCVIAFAAFPLFAQGDSSFPGSSLEVVGQVRLAGGQAPVETIIIRLENFNGGLADQTRPDTSGRFRFSNLRAGQYVVSAQVAGFISDRQQVEVSPRFMRRAQVFLNLSPERTDSSGPAEVIDVRVPVTARNEYARGRAALIERRIETAIAHLERAIGIYPDFFNAQSLLGTAYIGARQWDRAENPLRRAIEINPQAVAVLISLGEVYRRLGRHTEAEARLQEALRIDDQLWQGHFTLGRVYWEMGDMRKAGLHIGRTLQLNPNYPDARLMAGNIFLRVNLRQNALIEYEEYLRLAPNGEFAAQAREIIQRLRQTPRTTGN